jgi:hypothetical protein
MASRVDLESRQKVGLVSLGLPIEIGRDDHAFIVRDQDLGTASGFDRVGLGDRRVSRPLYSMSTFPY